MGLQIVKKLEQGRQTYIYIRGTLRSKDIHDEATFGADFMPGIVNGKEWKGMEIAIPVPIFPAPASRLVIQSLGIVSSATEIPNSELTHVTLF